jgi:hypothetical protein
MAFEGESLEKGDLSPEEGNLSPEEGNLSPEEGNLSPEEGDLSLELQSKPRYVLAIDLICGCGKWV